jgi:hypothetical protein
MIFTARVLPLLSGFFFSHGVKGGGGGLGLVAWQSCSRMEQIHIFSLLTQDQTFDSVLLDAAISSLTKPSSFTFDVSFDFNQDLVPVVHSLKFLIMNTSFWGGVASIAMDWSVSLACSVVQQFSHLSLVCSITCSCSTSRFGLGKSTLSVKSSRS